MLRILHVSPVGERGGVEVMLLGIMNCLDRHRFDPLVVLLEDGPFVTELVRSEVETRVIPPGRARDVVGGSRAVLSLVRLIRDRGIDVVHRHNAKAHIYGGLAARIARIPSVYHLHGVPKPAFSRDGFISLLSLAIPASRTVACSRYV